MIGRSQRSLPSSKALPLSQTSVAHSATTRVDAHARAALIRSFGDLAGGETLARLFGFVALIAMTRALGPGGFGLVALGGMLVIWVGLVADSGTETLGVREISRAPRDFTRIAEPVLGLRLTLSFVLGAMFVACLFLFVGRAGDRAALAPFALVLPALALNLRWMVVGLRGSRAVAVGNAAGQLLLMVGVLTLISRPHDAPRVGLLQAGAELLYAASVAVWAARRFGFIRPRIDISTWRRTLAESLPLMGFQFSRAVINFFDLLVIGIFLGRQPLGLYAAAYKPVMFVGVASGLFHVSFLASYSAIGPEHGVGLFRQVIRMALAVTVPVTLALSGGAAVFMGLLFGHVYTPGASALAVLAWTIPLGAVGGAYSQALITGNRQVTLMWHGAVAAGFNVVANLIAIPAGGITAAAAVTLASELLFTSLNYLTAVRNGLAPGRRQLV